MKKKSLSIFTAFIMFSFALVLFLPVPSQAKTIKLKYADFFPPVHKTSVTSKEWCMEVEKRTNGRVKITYLPGGTLVPAPQAYEAAVRGIADISMTVPAWAAGRFPLSEVLELPLGYTNAIHASGLALELGGKCSTRRISIWLRIAGRRIWHSSWITCGYWTCNRRRRPTPNAYAKNQPR